MEGFIRKIIMVCLILMMVMVMVMVKVAESKEPVLHYVGGGKYNWLPHVNLSQWSNTQLFYAGDWLYFGYDEYIYNVLEVNKTSYENCMESDFITNVTKGGRDVFQLTQAKPYYFICSRGSYCFQGLKVSINVQKYIPPPPPLPPSPATNGAPLKSNFYHRVVRIIVPVFILVWRIELQRVM